MALTIVRGQTVRIRTARGDGTHEPFRDASGTPTDPSTVTMRITTVSDSVTTDYTLAAAQVVKDTTAFPNGDFYYDFATAGLADAKLGRVVCAWLGTGTVQAAESCTFLLVSEKL